MIVKPRMRGFICTTAHPAGCAANVQAMVNVAKGHPLQAGPKRVLVIGASTGYGLASCIAAAFGGDADVVGVFFEREASGSRTGTPGLYNWRAFERLAGEAGRKAIGINGDAFSNGVREETVATIKRELGQVDWVVYSIAAPKRTDPDTGEVYSSAILPIGRPFSGKTVDFHTGEVSQVRIEPATEAEIAGTVKVMGGEDWLLWMRALRDADALAKGAAAMAYTYVGPKLTHAVYRDGTIGRAKADLAAKAAAIDELLRPIGGRAMVSVNKAVVTQASAAIPVVPLYVSLLFRLMKEKGTHEDCIEQMCRLLAKHDHAGSWAAMPCDENGMLRMDDWEMDEGIQARIAEIWDRVDTQNLESVADVAGYRSDFYRLFGFGIEGVDYEADVPV